MERDKLQRHLSRTFYDLKSSLKITLDEVAIEGSDVINFMMKLITDVERLHHRIVESNCLSKKTE